jgi:hypothetical protein
MAIKTALDHPTMVPSATGPRGVECYDRSVTDFDEPDEARADGGDPNQPHGFLAADTFVPLGPFSGGGAAIRGLLTPATVATGRVDRCALCGRPNDDPIHVLAGA